MTDLCGSCSLWTVARKTLYADGSVVATYEAAPGKGLCEVLNLEVPVDFGCTRHEQAAAVSGLGAALHDPSGTGYCHVDVSRKDGAPWQHSRSGPCPDCRGAGSTPDSAGGCGRCVGTGQVRHYDDGFIGENKHCLHPKERELRERRARENESRRLQGLPALAPEEPQPPAGTTLAPKKKADRQSIGQGAVTELPPMSPANPDDQEQQQA